STSMGFDKSRNWRPSALNDLKATLQMSHLTLDVKWRF
ncbi:MAG: hypothetical protein ACI84R_002444, partial [Candidatus Azotimanducaceae bacterium]